MLAGIVLAACSVGVLRFVFTAVSPRPVELALGGPGF